MIKKIIALITCMTVLFVFTSCNNDGEENVIDSGKQEHALCHI